MKIERVKTIPSFPGYNVSDLGNVYKGNRLLANGKTSDGYPSVSIKSGNRWIRIAVHRLVCEAFHGIKPTPKHEVGHKDGSRTNNHPSNLRWVTRKENMEDRTLHGTAAACEDNGRAKLTNKDVIEIRYMHKQGAHWKTLAYAYEVSRSTIFYILAGKTWKNPSGDSETTASEESK